MENPSRAMPKRKATGQAIIVDELYDSDEFEPDSAVKKQKNLALPAPESRFVVPPSPGGWIKIEKYEHHRYDDDDDDGDDVIEE